MRTRLIRTASVALLLAVALPAAAEERTLVMPFDNQQRDAAVFWLGEASAALVGDDLNALGGNAFTRGERQQAFDRLQVPAVAVLSDATVIRLGQLIGAGQVIVGSFERDGDTLTVHARSIALEAGRVQADVTERGAIGDLYNVFDRLSRRLLPAGTAAPRTAPPAEHPPVEAFENYIKGLLAQTPDTAVRYLRAALMLYPAYDQARLALWDVYVDEGEFDDALAAVREVPASSPLSRRARFLAGVAQLQARSYDAAFATYKALADEQSLPTVMNNLGVIQLRRPATAAAGTPTYYFDRAATLDPDDPDYFFNLGYAYWEGRDTQAAIYWLKEAVRRNPADGDAHFVLGVALSAAGNLTEAAREKELANRLSSTYEQWERRPGPDPVPRGLERLKTVDVEQHARQIEARIASTTQRDQQSLAEFYLASGRRLFEQQRDHEAAADLARAIYLSPYLAEAHLLAGRIHLRSGRVREAIDAFKISLWSAESADAHAALADAYLQAKDNDAARAEAQRALALDPVSADAKRVLDMLKSP